VAEAIGTAESVEDVDVGYEEPVAVQDVVESEMGAAGMVVDLEIVVVAAVGIVAESDETRESDGRKEAVVTKEAVVETEAVCVEETAAS
jgi:hypothetical protein